MNYSISILNTLNPLIFPILVIIGLLLGKAVYTYKSFPDLRGKAIRELLIGIPVTILILVIFIIAPLIAGVSINKSELSLRLSTGFTFATLSKDEILSARIVDLETQPEFALKSKVIGTKIRDYREGIFQLENGTEVEVFLNGKKALYIETTGKPLLLGPDHFDNFVKDFNENIKPLTP